MGVVILFLTKPIWYAIAFGLAARYWGSYGSHWRLPTWAVVVMAALLRYAVGFGPGMLAMGAHHRSPVLFYLILVGCGFALWLLVARVAFRRAPLTELAEFAALAELVSAGIDLLAWREISNINMC
jgi:hypothetical protein